MFQENVTFFCSLYGYRGRDLKERVDNALEFVGLLDIKNKKAKEFSGGMKRRLNMACAIAHNPRLIIMDEPTVGIDPQSRNHILESVRKLNEQGSTIIYTSHYMEEIEELCNNISIMDNIVRAIPFMTKIAEDLKTQDKQMLKEMIYDFDNEENLKDRKMIRRSMLTNPFEKFERKRFMYYSKDLSIISLNHALFSQMTSEDWERVKKQMNEDLANYYKELGGT